MSYSLRAFIDGTWGCAQHTGSGELLTRLMDGNIRLHPSWGRPGKLIGFSESQSPQLCQETPHLVYHLELLRGSAPTLYVNVLYSFSIHVQMPLSLTLLIVSEGQ